jgi:hypothetical protein
LLHNITTNVPDDIYDIILEVRQANGSTAQKSTRVLITAHLLAQFGEPSLSSVKLADLDGDGKSEVIVTTLETNPALPGPQGGGSIHVLSSSGSELPGWPVTLNGRPLNNTAAVGDIDGDGRLEIVVETFGNTSQPSGTDPRKVWAFNATGTLKPGFPVAISSNPLGDGWSTGLFGNTEFPSPALADLDGDGVPEIIAISEGSGFGTDGGVVLALKGNGGLVFKTTLPRSVPPGRFFDEWPHYSVPMIGHLTGGATPEIVVGVHADAGNPPYTTFFALTATGALLSGWPVRLPGTTFETGVLGDLNRDGHDEFIVTSQRMGSTPASLYVFNGSGQVMSGFPTDLPGSGPMASYPALADVDHDGFLDIVTFEDADLSNQSQDINYYLVSHNRLGQLVSQTAWPAINNNQFGQQFHQLRLALSEDNTGQVCAVFPVPQFTPNQSKLQLQARCLNGQVVSGFPLTQPSLCDSFSCRGDATSVSLARDSGSAQVYSVLIDQTGKIWRWDIFNSTRPIPWSQFQQDAANAGLARNPQTLTVTKTGTGTGTLSSSLSGINCGATCSADFNSGTVLALTASPNAGSSFAGWTGDCTGLGGCQVTMSQARNVTATFTLTPTPIQVTVQTNPSGRTFTVDGSSYSGPQTLSWTPGSSHTVSTISPQSGGTGTQFLWTSWSDGGVIAHTVVAPSSSTTYTANFTTQYFLTMNAGTGGTISPSSGWYNSGTGLGISATPNPSYVFSGWSGSGSGSFSGTSNPTTITMNGPITQAAAFAQPLMQLLLDQSGPALDQLAALDSILFLRDPFPVVNSSDALNLGVDRNTRVIIFVTNLQLAQGETSSAVVVSLVDSNNQSYDVAAEDVRFLSSIGFTQVIFRLPNSLSVGTCTIKVKAHSQVSNGGAISIRT